MEADELWRRYLREVWPDEPERRYVEAFTFGNTEEAADRLAQLVLSGGKTATSELLWSREAGGTPLWHEGGESIVLNGRGEAVCVVRTTELRVIPFDQVDEAFILDYGEGDGTLAWWRRDIWAYYAEECRTLGREPGGDMPLICERFEVVYPK